MHTRKSRRGGLNSVRSNLPYGTTKASTKIGLNIIVNSGEIDHAISFTDADRNLVPESIKTDQILMLKIIHNDPPQSGVNDPILPHTRISVF